MSGYLIIGGTGSLGQRLIARLLPESRVDVYSRDEAKHWTIRNDLSCGPLADRARDGLGFYVGDVRDGERIRDVLRQVRPHTVIVASALKQVDTCELTPFESVQTNLLGMRNVIEAVNAQPFHPRVDRLLLVSTDKACSPVNVYGMCKALAERLVTSQARTGCPDVRYLAVRYGNVLESRGSILPLFRHQAAHAEHLTVTDPDMTRFVMTLDQSVDLIRQTLVHGRSGETWIPHLPAMRVGDMAAIFAQRAGKPIKIIGHRPGEKMHEALVDESESTRTRAIGNGHRGQYAIGPAFEAGVGQRFTYTSADSVLSRLELATLLDEYGVLDLPLDRFPGRAIEEIATNRQS